MQFWDDLNPTVRKAVYVGAALVVVLLALRYFASTPVANATTQRGVGAAAP